MQRGDKWHNKCWRSNGTSCSKLNGLLTGGLCLDSSISLMLDAFQLLAPCLMQSSKMFVCRCCWLMQGDKVVGADGDKPAITWTTVTDAGADAAGCNGLLGVVNDQLLSDQDVWLILGQFDARWHQRSWSRPTMASSCPPVEVWATVRAAEPVDRSLSALELGEAHWEMKIAEGRSNEAVGSTQMVSASACWRCNQPCN